MANATGTVRAGRAYVEILLNDTKLEHGLRRAQAKLRAFGVSLTRIGTGMVAAATAMAAPIVLATKTFSSFDDTMRMAKAVTGATRAEFESLTRVAEELGRTTSFTAQQVASGMVALGRMGFSPKEIEDSISSILNLARATGTELSEAAEIAANNMRVFSIDTEKMSSVADVLTATANGSAQTLTDLAEALKMAGPQATAANDTLINVSAALGVLANMGIRGSLAGTALRKSYSQFAKTDVRDKLLGIGIATADANGNLRSMPDIMRDIAKAMNAMPTAERIGFAESIFDLRGSLAGLQLGGNIEQLDAFIERLNRVDNASAETAKEMDSGIGGAMRILLSAFEGCQLAIGRIIGDALMPYIVSLTASLESIAKWIEAHSEFVVMATKVTATIIGVGAALLAAGVAMKVIAVSVGGLAIAFGVLKTAVVGPIVLVQKIAGLFSALPAVMGIVKTSAIAMWGAITSPAALVGTALAGIVAGVFYLSGAWDVCADAASVFAGDVVAAFASIGQIASGTFGAIKDAILSGNLAGACKVALAGMRLAWLTGLLPVKTAWYEFVEGLQDAWTIFRFAVLKAANNVWFGLRTGLQETGMWISRTWDAIWNGIVSAFDAVVANLKKDWILLQKVFDWSIDIEAKFAEVDAESDKAKAKRKADSDDNVRKQEEKRVALSAEWDKANADLDAGENYELVQNREEKDVDIDDAKADIAAAQAAFNAAMEDIRRKAEEKKTVTEEVVARKAEQAAEGTRYAEKVVERDRNPARVFGSWSANELAGMLGGGNSEERIEKHTEQMVRISGESRDYLRKIQTGGSMKYT